ncbi:MAG: hypothetical protein ACQGVC_10705 [Myxococcota bacterium]
MKRGLVWIALLLLGMPGAPAQAAVHGLAGNARFQVSSGLPLPITPLPPPDGRILPKAGGPNTVMQTGMVTGPRRVTIPPGALTAAGTPWTLAVFLANSQAHQVRTALRVAFPRTLTASGGPAGSVVFSAGGRTGPPTVTYCAGAGVTPPFTCTPFPGPVMGILRYTATANQFGGPARFGTAGSATVWMRGGSSPPCSYAGGLNPNCLAVIVKATPGATGGQGRPFGEQVTVVRPGTASGVRYATITGAGAVVASTPTPSMNPGLAHTFTSWGGPWTTGMITASVHVNVGVSLDLFILSGSDRRGANGRGRLSLVSGALSARTLSGPSANRGWLNLEFGPPQGAHVPALPAGWLAALSLLLLAAGARLGLRRS